VLAKVDHVVGYGPYLIAADPATSAATATRTVELERAPALDLALGPRFAVVSGDAGIFGMASAVFEAAAADGYADVEITVLPGVTAAQAVAARAGAPLGGDYAVVSLSDRLKPWPVIERRLRAVAEADLVLAIYNPASRTRREQIVRARELLLELRLPDTPVVVGRHVGRDGESLTVTTLGALEPDSIDMSCLLIIGSSQTRLGHNATVWTQRSYT
jgi:precorrin-2 C20-methyltransferase/precorrin-3B C17-methyltransferase